MRKMVVSALAIASILAACGKSETKQKPAAETAPPVAEKAPPAATDRIEISVTDKGFEPDNVSVPSGKPVTLVFTRKSDSTCAKEVVIPLDGTKIEKKLPLNEAVAIDVTFPKAGSITYACGMDMVKGTLTVQ